MNPAYYRSPGIYLPSFLVAEVGFERLVAAPDNEAEEEHTEQRPESGERAGTGHRPPRENRAEPVPCRKPSPDQSSSLKELTLMVCAEEPTTVNGDPERGHGRAGVKSLRGRTLYTARDGHRK